MNPLFFILCACVCAFSASVDLCVSFESEDLFSVRVLKVNSVEKMPQWKLGDSVECECGKWRQSFVISDFPEPVLIANGYSCIVTRIGNGKKEKLMKMPPVPEMNLREGDVVYPAGFFTDKKEISSKFKMKVDLLWKAKFVCPGDHSKDTTLVYKMNANIVGECPK